MKFIDVLLSILQHYWTKYENYPTKTKLLKLGYLVDVLYTRKFRRQLSDAEWIYYLFGPYVMDFDNILESGPFEHEEVETKEDWTATIVVPAREPKEELDLDARIMISTVVSDFGGLLLNDLLDHVYFDTEPMINADRRGEKLDFSTVQPQEFYKVRELKIDRKKEQAIRKAFRDKVRKIRGEGAI